MIFKVPRILVWAVLVSLACLSTGAASAQTQGKALILQEMAWTDVRDYLKSNDMVIIPLGSTEQHGPHLPLGTDFYVALDTAKAISARTGVIVAPVVMAGYSLYHSGFPGTLSLKPETLEEVLYETATMLIKYGFRRIMLFNYHGGNNVVQQNVVYRINQTTEATAVAIGYGGPILKLEDQEFFDWHAGLEETSMILYFEPPLARMERAEKPVIHFTPQMEELRKLGQTSPELLVVWESLFGTPAETKKGGSSAELSSTGVWCLSDPKTSRPELGEKIVKGMVDQAVKFIEAWKAAK
ncbi:MAG TPA: creatininase family protein [Burkholderiales bacterium]|nr:creatininase family protein [Burkholderiales bacterium]